MPEVQLNYVAVLVAAVLNMIVGSLWYSPLLFAKQWLSATGKTLEQIQAAKKGAWKAYLGSFLGALVMSYVLGYLLALLEVSTIAGGVQTAFWVWLGFVITTSLSELLFEKRSPTLFLINKTYHLVALIVMAALLAVWR